MPGTDDAADAPFTSEDTAYVLQYNLADVLEDMAGHLIERKPHDPLDSLIRFLVEGHTPITTMPAAAAASPFASPTSSPPPVWGSAASGGIRPGDEGGLAARAVLQVRQGCVRFVPGERPRRKPLADIATLAPEWPRLRRTLEDTVRKLKKKLAGRTAWKEGEPRMVRWLEEAMKQLRE
eukprot:gene14138-29942_t